MHVEPTRIVLFIDNNTNGVISLTDPTLLNKLLLFSTFDLSLPCQLLAANSWRFLFAHICRNSLFIICSLQNSSYCLLSTISGIFTINALLQQPCVPFHFDKQASFATSTPTNFCLQNHKCFLRQVKDFMV